MSKSFPRRKSPRLQGYDYSREGAYFITICTNTRVHLLGKVENDRMVLSDMGQIAESRWRAIPDHHPGVELDAFVIMPNHVHGIVLIVGTGPASSATTTPDNAGVVPTPKAVLGTVIGSYKSGVTRIARRQGLIDDSASPWQGRYHDHIIHNERRLNTLRTYIATNPARWADDTFFTP
ncbi:MAG: transposase [Chloroflexota bacterium]